MKAYVLKQTAALTPFKKPVSAVQFRGCSIGSRLAQQLRDSGLDVVPVDEVDPRKMDGNSLVIQDDMFLSDGFIQRFLQAIPDKSKSYQCEVDTSCYPLLASLNPDPLWSSLPVFYYGSDVLTAQGNENVLRLTPNTVHTVVQGLPARMNEVTDMRLYFQDFYSIQVKYWFDLQAASSLYCREFISTRVGMAKQYLPAKLVDRTLNWQWLMERSNKIGKNCRIHPTAILEGCVIGDNVEVGPYSYLRSAVIDDDVVLRENTSIKMSYIGKAAFVMSSDIVNSYVGEEASIITPMLYNTVFGERSFVSGGSGFADFNVGSGDIVATINGEDIPTGLNYLASCVGDDCFIGANMIFSPGRCIPDGSNFLDNGLIKDVPEQADGTYVLSGKQFLQIPSSFLGAK